MLTRLCIFFILLTAIMTVSNIDLETTKEVIQPHTVRSNNLNIKDTVKKDNTTPASIQMHKSINKYSIQYDIPKHYIYGIAYNETGYKGPFHWSYKHDRVSSAGALGPLQLMYSTAKSIMCTKDFSKEMLRTDIDLNVECGIKTLRYLYDKHGDWKKVFGAYNTGKPIVNEYAMRVYNFNSKTLF